MSIGFALASCASSFAIGPALAAPPLPVVQQLDLDRYVGQWHEIARYPNFFERMCVGDVTATYARNPDGTISVVNACRKDDGSMVRAEGLARVVAPAKLQVRFAPSWLGFSPVRLGRLLGDRSRAGLRLRRGRRAVARLPLDSRSRPANGRCNVRSHHRGAGQVRLRRQQAAAQSCARTLTVGEHAERGPRTGGTLLRRNSLPTSAREN
jgi:hypothetical protein